MGSLSLLFSSALIEHRAGEEPVQIEASELLERSRRGYRLAGALGGVALVALGASVVFYWLENSP